MQSSAMIEVEYASGGAGELLRPTPLLSKRQILTEPPYALPYKSMRTSAQRGILWFAHWVYAGAVEVALHLGVVQSVLVYSMRSN